MPRAIHTFFKATRFDNLIIRQAKRATLIEKAVLIGQRRTNGNAAAICSAERRGFGVTSRKEIGDGAAKRIAIFEAGRIWRHAIDPAPAIQKM